MFYVNLKVSLNKRQIVEKNECSESPPIIEAYVYLVLDLLPSVIFFPDVVTF